MTFEPRKPADYRLLLQDCGEPLLRQSWPPKREGLKEATVADFRDHPIDVYSYDINLACGVYHPSEVYHRMGDGVDVFQDRDSYRCKLVV